MSSERVIFLLLFCSMTERWCIGGPLSVQLFVLPACAGGLGISDPIESASMAFYFWAVFCRQAEFCVTANLDIHI